MNRISYPTQTSGTRLSDDVSPKTIQKEIGLKDVFLYTQKDCAELHRIGEFMLSMTDEIKILGPLHSDFQNISN